MMVSRGRLLVAVVNFRSVRHTAALLGSLENEPVDQIVVLDNASGNGEWSGLVRLVERVPQAYAVRSPTNLGFGGGANEAVAHLAPSDSDYVWLLNPDIRVNPGAAGRLRDCLAAGGVDIASPLIVSGDAQDQVWFAGGEVDLRRGATDHPGYGGPVGNRSGVVSTGFVSGAAPMMTGRAWRMLGGYRDEFFLYWEDADLSLRARKMGLEIAVDFDSTVWHEEGGSGDGEGRSQAYYFYMQRNRARVMKEAGRSNWDLLSGRGGLETLRLLARSVREPESRAPKLRAGLRGLRAGLRWQPQHQHD